MKYMAKKSKQNTTHVQFSKKIVVFVNIAVTVLSLIAIVLCWNGGDLKSLTDVVRTYIQFSMVVFASYSCNSIAQKVITNNQMDKIFKVTNEDEEQKG